MKILKKGQLPKECVYIITCNVCQTEFEAQEREGELHDTQRGGWTVTFECPLDGCGHPITVHREKILKLTI